MSFLSKEDEKPSAFWDWVVGIGLVVLIGGFTVYYQWQKRVSLREFHAADDLFKAGKFREAESAYERLKNASYLTAANDSIIYTRLDSVRELEEREGEALARLRGKLAAGDTAGARRELEGTTFHGLLGEAQSRWVDSVRGAL